MEARKLESIDQASAGGFRTELPALVDGLRKSFNSGKTRPIQWRLDQLEGCGASATGAGRTIALSLRGVTPPV